MLPLDDPRWSELTGRYRTPYNPSDCLRRLQNGDDVWDELWQELHHQGDVGEASYAAVPYIVSAAKSLALRDWKFYGLVSTIEIERHRKANPPMPIWLVSEYADALRGLFELAMRDLAQVEDRDTIRCILGAIALAKDELKLGVVIHRGDAAEIDEFLEQNEAWSELYE